MSSKPGAVHIPSAGLANRQEQKRLSDLDPVFKKPAFTNPELYCRARTAGRRVPLWADELPGQQWGHCSPVGDDAEVSSARERLLLLDLCGRLACGGGTVGTLGSSLQE